MSILFYKKNSLFRLFLINNNYCSYLLDCTFLHKPLCPSLNVSAHERQVNECDNFHMPCPHTMDFSASTLPFVLPPVDKYILLATLWKWKLSQACPCVVDVRGRRTTLWKWKLSQAPTSRIYQLAEANSCRRKKLWLAAANWSSACAGHYNS